jgi:Xaa-Pro aminopeptidase
MECLQVEQERNGARFDRAVMLETRDRTRRVMNQVAGAITPGMVEEDAVALMRRSLKAADMLRGWHGIHVRFGPNTLRNFGEPSEPGVVLARNDIFFIDIGPVWQGHEGDAGATFTVGDDPEMHRAAQDVKAIFDATRNRWREDGLSGVGLYRFAEAEAGRLGWAMNLDMSGHRISDFPHKILHDGALLDADYVPSDGAWVLEIQIRHPGRPFSAFYEDLLLQDDPLAAVRAPDALRGEDTP